MPFSHHKCFMIALFISAFFDCNNKIPNWKTEIARQKELSVSEAEKSITIGLNIIKNCNSDSIKAHSYSTLGLSYYSIGDYLNSFRNCLKAQEELSKHKISTDQIVYNNMCLIETYYRIGLIDRSVSEIKKTIALIEEKDPENNSLKGMIYAVYANILLDQKKYKETLLQYSKALQYFNKVNDPKQLETKMNYITQLNSETSNVYMLLNDFKKAEIYANKADQLMTTSTNYYISRINNIRLGTIYSITNRPQEAIKILEPLKDDKNIEPPFQLDIHESLYHAYKEIGDDIKSEREKLAIVSVRSLMSTQQSQALKDILVKVDNELNRKEQQHTFLQIITVAGVLSSLIITYLLFRKYNVRLRKEGERYQEIITNLESQIHNKLPVEVCKKIKNEGACKLEFTKTELDIIERLDKFEAKKRFLKKDLTLAVLAVELNTNASYLSDIINRSKNKNFNTYINELRIEYIIKEICSDSKLLNYKISHLADISGFNSHNTFALVFKKITGISPSTFIEQRKAETEKSMIYK